MSATVFWFPERLTARLIAAATPARVEWAGAARARCSSTRVAASIAVLGDTVAAIHPLAPIVEFGAKPHTITPKHKVLRLADGSFVSGPIQHPGARARPFLRPTLPLWPSLYRRHGAGAFRGL